MSTYQQCGSFTGAGMSNCNKRMKKPVGILVSETGTVYTAAELASFTKTKANLMTHDGIKSLFIPISEYKDTTDAPEIIKSPSLGTKGKFDDQLPSFTVYLDRSFDDYKSLFGSDNALVSVELITRDGFRLMTPTADNGSFTGFSMLMAVNAGLPNMDAPMEAYPIEFFARDFEQFRNMEAIPMTNYGFTDLLNNTPVGLNARCMGEYNTTTGLIDVQVKFRASDTGKAGITTFDILSSSTTGNVVTLTDGGAGSYSVSILKATTAKLEVGDYIWLQGKVVSGEFATYITNPLYVVVTHTTT